MNLSLYVSLRPEGGTLFFQFSHICDRAAEDEQVEKTD